MVKSGMISILEGSGKLESEKDRRSSKTSGDKTGRETDRDGFQSPSIVTTACAETAKTIVSPMKQRILKEFSAETEDYDMIEISSRYELEVSPLAPHISSITSQSTPSLLISSLVPNEVDIAIHRSLSIHSNLTDNKNTDESKPGFFKLLNNVKIKMDSVKFPILQEEESNEEGQLVKKLSMRIRQKPGSFSTKRRNSSFKVAVSDKQPRSRKGSGATKEGPER